MFIFDVSDYPWSASDDNGVETVREGVEIGCGLNRWRHLWTGPLTRRRLNQSNQFKQWADLAAACETTNSPAIPFDFGTCLKLHNQRH